MRKNLTILLSKAFPPAKGGISTYIYNLFNTAAKEMDILVVTNTPSSSEEYLGNFKGIIRSFVPIGKSGIFRIDFYAKAMFSLFVNKDRLKNVVCDNIFPAGMIGYIFKKIFKDIDLYVVTYGSEVIRNDKKWYTLFRKKLFDASKEIITISRYTSNEVKLLTSRPVTIVPPGYCGGFSSVEGISKPIRILTVAALTPRKGHLLVLDALNKSKEKINFKYTIVGNGFYKTEILKRIDELNFTSSVEILSNVDNNSLDRIYRNSDIFIMPTYKNDFDIEGFGIVYLEAGAHSLPVIATPIGGVTDVVEDGENGVFVEEKNIEQIADAIVKLASNKALREKMGVAGQKIAKNFSYSKSAQILLKILR